MIRAYERNERDRLILSDGMYEEHDTTYNGWRRRWDVNSHLRTLLRHHLKERNGAAITHAMRVGQRFGRQLRRNGQTDMLEPQYVLWIMGQFKLRGVHPMLYAHALEYTIQEASK